MKDVADEFSDQEKASATLFCSRFKRIFYGEGNLFLRNEVLDCRQKAEESVSDYAARLQSKAEVAYSTLNEVNDNCFLSFIRNLYDKRLQMKIREVSPSSFKDAVKRAKLLESIQSGSSTVTQDTTPVRYVEEGNMPSRFSR